MFQIRYNPSIDRMGIRKVRDKFIDERIVVLINRPREPVICFVISTNIQAKLTVKKMIDGNDLFAIFFDFKLIDLW